MVLGGFAFNAWERVVGVVCKIVSQGSQNWAKQTPCLPPQHQPVYQPLRAGGPLEGTLNYFCNVPHRGVLCTITITR